MEHNLTGSPLEPLWDSFRELTTKIEANELTLDEALPLLQSQEVVDAAGNTWRMDPVTQSFVRRAAGTDGPWRQATPSEFVLYASVGTAAVSPQPPAQAVPDGRTADPLRPPAQYSPANQPALLPTPPPQEGSGRTKPRWPIYAGGGVAALVVLVVILALAGQGKHSTTNSSQTGTAKPTATPSSTSGTQSKEPRPQPSSGAPSSSPTGNGPNPAPTNTTQAGAGPAPSEPVYDGVVSEFTSGDVARIQHVTETSQYSPTSQRYYAATFGGWAEFGLKIKAEAPVGDPSSHTATQVWDLVSRGDIIARAAVTWHQASSSAPWLLTKWPEFQPVR